MSISALLLSLVAMSSWVYFSRVNSRTAVPPTLVFVHDVQKGWSLRNVGSAPALNVVVAHQADGSDTWLKPTRLYPLPAGAEVPIGWVGHTPDKLATVYSDAEDREYTSLADRTKLLAGPRQFSWSDDEIRPVWER